MAAQYYEGIGRRKAATARVRITAGGTGSVIINDKDGSDYLPRPGDVDILLEPLTLLGQAKTYDVSVHVNGGGISGQRDAILLGIARALFSQPQLHGIDFGLLIDQNLLGQSTDHGVRSVDQFSFRHVDCALVMRDHHGGEIVVDISVHQRRCHLTIHAFHASIHLFHEPCTSRRHLGRCY